MQIKLSVRAEVREGLLAGCSNEQLALRLNKYGKPHAARPWLRRGPGCESDSARQVARCQHVIVQQQPQKAACGSKQLGRNLPRGVRWSIQACSSFSLSGAPAAGARARGSERVTNWVEPCNDGPNPDRPMYSLPNRGLGYWFGQWE